MSIKGSLEDFSIPEIIQIIDNGFKSGRLSINSGFNSFNSQISHNKGTNYLWFQNGDFVALSNPSQYHNLLNLIKKENWLTSKEIVKLYTAGHNLNHSFGEYCLANSFLNQKQIQQLFEEQLATVYSLFELEHGWFIFEDADENNQVSERKEAFPVIEMTGQKCQAINISLQAMRSLTKLAPRLTEQMPEPNSGLIRLVDNLSLKLLPIEACLFDDANGKNSLKKIAQKTLFEIEDLQKAALRLILIGFLEEVPIAEYSLPAYTTSSLNQELAFAAASNLGKNKSQKAVSNSLLGNLVSFLRNNF